MPLSISPTVALMGEFLLHPGVVAGVEVPVAGEHVWLSGQAGAYVHPRNHVGARVDAAIGVRHTTSSGPFVEAFGGVGYLHTFSTAPVWVVDGGEAARITDAGRPAFMPTITIGTGWEGEKVAPFVRVQAFGQFPFNAHLLPHAALMVGVRWT
jgi:hypothetical protein